MEPHFKTKTDPQPQFLVTICFWVNVSTARASRFRDVLIVFRDSLHHSCHGKPQRKLSSIYRYFFL